MTLDDLSSHDSEVITPISTDYKVKSVTSHAEAIGILITCLAEGMTPLCAQGVRLWEPPPNSQGLAALLLLNILEGFPLKGIQIIKIHFHIRDAQINIYLLPNMKCKTSVKEDGIE